MSNKHHGSSLDDFLKEEGIFAAVEATARGLHGAGVMSTATLRELQRMALTPDEPTTQPQPHSNAKHGTT